jgi:hypothetical protein
MHKVRLWVMALTLSALASPAMADVIYSNTADGQTIAPFGAPDTTNDGETFSLSSAATLSAWSFFATAGDAGNEELVVAAWNGSAAVGPALYTSAVNSSGGGPATLSFTGIGTTLSAGNYIAYLTVAGVADPVSDVVLAAANGDGGLGGQFYYANTTGANPLTSPATWYSLAADSPGIQQLQFSADFASASLVPLPTTVWLMLSGLCGLGFLGRTRPRI